MQPIAEYQGEGTVSFAFPDPDPLPPPLINLDHVAIGYDGKPVLRGLTLRLDPDDRIALLGANGNGKSTLIKLLAGRLAPLEGQMVKSGKLRVGYFAQHQAEELDLDGDADPRAQPAAAARAGGPAAQPSRPLRLLAAARRDHASAICPAARRRGCCSP